MRLLLLILICLHCVCGYSQTNTALVVPRPVPNAPNTAALGKFGDYEVSLFTGLPSISIPLYTIKTRAFEVPIVLQYHASGNKITDYPSWVGLGWALEVAGSIRRSVVGQPDEGPDGFLMNNQLDMMNIDKNTQAGMDYLNNLASAVKDGESDIYSYSFPGSSGKFFFEGNSNKTVVSMPRSPDRINRIWSSASPTALSFSIDDAKGAHFEFSAANTETSTDYTNPSPHAEINAWMLDRMVSPNRDDTISFSYTSQSYPVAEDDIDKWTVEDLVGIRDPDSRNYYSPSYASLVTSQNYSVSALEKANSQILFKNGKVDFELSSSVREDFGALSGHTPKPLNRIIISNFNYATATYEVQKKIQFFYSYFISGSDAFTKRLRLDSIQFQDKNGIPVETYKFQYENSINFPRRNSKSRDYWGYYNAKSNTSLIPNTTIPDYQASESAGGAISVTIGSTTIGGRDPDPAYMQMGVLKRIVYPTKGYTDFEYETNQYLNAQSVVKYAGGLRIKSVSTYDDVNTIPKVKTYVYGLNGNGYGRANFDLSSYLFKQSYFQRHILVQFINNEPTLFKRMTEIKRVRIYLSNPTLSLFPYDNAPVSYANVTEYFGTPTNNSGKTEYVFKDASDVMLSASMVRPTKNSYFFARGALLNKKTYKKIAGSSTYYPTGEEINSYQAFPDSIYGLNLLAGFYYVDEGSNWDPGRPENDNKWLYANYTIITGDLLPTAKTTIKYNTDDVTKFVKNEISMLYRSKKHLLPSVTTIKNSRDETIVSSTTYPADYISAGNWTTNAVLDSMLARNMQAYPVEIWDTLFKPAGSYMITAGLLNGYRRLANGALVRDYQKKLKIDQPITDFIKSGIAGGTLTSDARYFQVIKFDQYDAWNNLTQYTPYNGPVKSFIWDYGGALPVADVTNAAINEVAYTSFETPFMGNWTSTAAISNGSTRATGTREAVVNGTTASISGLSTGKTYLVTYWCRGAAGSLTISGTVGSAQLVRTVGEWKNYRHKVTGVSSVTVSGSGSNVFIDELRIHPEAASMITLAFAPNGEIREQNDAANKITYFEFDSFGRLQAIRDNQKNIISTHQYNYKQ